MRCEDIQIHLLDGLKNAQDPALPTGFAEHLATCAECRELRELWLALDEAPVAPDPDLSARFRERLRREHPKPLPGVNRLSGWALPLAAALLLAISGAFAAGYVLRGEAPSSPRQAALARLRQGTPASRMQSIALVSNRGGDAEMAGALLNRVMQDPSLEVRLSAVEALYLFGSDPALGQRITEALPRQTRPEVQLAMVDLMVALRERRAAEALRHLLQDARLNPEVRRRAETRLAEQRL